MCNTKLPKTEIGVCNGDKCLAKGDAPTFNPTTLPNNTKDANEQRTKAFLSSNPIA